MELLLGVVVSGENVIGVCLQRGSESYKLVDEFTWSLQAGDRADAYTNMFERVKGYVSENAIDKVVIKASAVGAARPRLGHLHSAELRGVVIAAARAARAAVVLVQKATISRTFGSRKVDEYVSDDGYWDKAIIGDVAKTRREAAFLVISEKGAS